jgi:hypothetical protein
MSLLRNGGMLNFDILFFSFDRHFSITNRLLTLFIFFHYFSHFTSLLSFSNLSDFLHLRCLFDIQVIVDLLIRRSITFDLADCRFQLGIDFVQCSLLNINDFLPIFFIDLQLLIYFEQYSFTSLLNGG